jgi:hypothetical protein
MSNKNNINDFLNITTTEYKPSIDNIRIINKNNVHQIQQGGSYSPTSSFNQLGGVNNKDVNNLVSMLTSDSHMDSILGSNTSTVQLENKLKNLLNQEGGNYNKTNYANNNYNSNFIKQNNQRGGVSQAIAIGAAAALAYGLTSESDFVGNLFGKSKETNNNVDITTTDMDMNNGSVTSSAMPMNNNLSTTSEDENVFQKPNRQFSSSVTSSEVPMNNNFSSTSDNVNQKGGAYSVTSTAMPNNNYLSATSENFNQKQRGGRHSITSSAMHMNNNLSATSDIMSQEGGNNPALVAYREIVKMVVKELGITYPKALKIAAQVQKDVKEKNADVTPDKLVKLANEQFKSTRSKYEKMAPK